MPSSKGFKMFLRKEKLTEDEWFEMIEARREMIKPHLNSFSLQELGRLKCLDGDNGQHDVLLDINKAVKPNDFSLRTQGVFAAPSASREIVKDGPSVSRVLRSDLSPFFAFPYRKGLLRIWGLTRSNRWILATVSYTEEPGYKGRFYERATEVEIQESNPMEISKSANIEPRFIWQFLGEAIKDFRKRREDLYQQANDLAAIVEIEERALEKIPK